MVTSEKLGLGIKGIDELHFYVRDLARSRDHYVQRLDFTEVAVSSAAYEREQRARASLLEAGNVRFVFIEPLAAVSESQRFLSRHPEGVGRIVLEVEGRAARARPAARAWSHARIGHRACSG